MRGNLFREQLHQSGNIVQTEEKIDEKDRCFTERRS